MIKKLFLLCSLLLVGCSSGSQQAILLRTQHDNAILEDKVQQRILANCGEKRDGWVSTGDVTRNSAGKTAQQWETCRKAVRKYNLTDHNQMNNRIDHTGDVLTEDFLRLAPMPGTNPARTCLDRHVIRYQAPGANGTAFSQSSNHGRAIGQIDANGNITLIPGYESALQNGTLQNCN